MMLPLHRTPAGDLHPSWAQEVWQRGSLLDQLLRQLWPFSCLLTRSTLWLWCRDAAAQNSTHIIHVLSRHTHTPCSGIHFMLSRRSSFYSRPLHGMHYQEKSIEPTPLSTRSRPALLLPPYSHPIVWLSSRNRK